ncbi:hypothetical protein BLOT_010070 [Blomia tropicalis]|nr:hypothetical protein BLOT_010070 [Blomia tropicalis]
MSGANGRKKQSTRDPLSHRMIEKRRRDRMNNCLTDLSRLIPNSFIKKSSSLQNRGRIEKTEIIEMAIKYMKHLQTLAEPLLCDDGPLGPSPTSTPVPSVSEHDQLFAMCSSHSANAGAVLLKDRYYYYRCGYKDSAAEAARYLEANGQMEHTYTKMLEHLHQHQENIGPGVISNYMMSPQIPISYAELHQRSMNADSAQHSPINSISSGSPSFNQAEMVDGSNQANNNNANNANNPSNIISGSGGNGNNSNNNGMEFEPNTILHPAPIGSIVSSGSISSNVSSSSSTESASETKSISNIDSDLKMEMDDGTKMLTRSHSSSPKEEAMIVSQQMEESISMTVLKVLNSLIDGLKNPNVDQINDSNNYESKYKDKDDKKMGQFLPVFALHPSGQFYVPLRVEAKSRKRKSIRSKTTEESSSSMVSKAKTSQHYPSSISTIMTNFMGDLYPINLTVNVSLRRTVTLSSLFASIRDILLVLNLDGMKQSLFRHNSILPLSKNASIRSTSSMYDLDQLETFDLSHLTQIANRLEQNLTNESSSAEQLLNVLGVAAPTAATSNNKT